MVFDLVADFGTGANFSRRNSPTQAPTHRIRFAKAWGFAEECDIRDVVSGHGWHAGEALRVLIHLNLRYQGRSGVSREVRY